MIRILLIALLLTACVPTGLPPARSWFDGVTFLAAPADRNPIHKDILVIGDSLCASIYDNYDGTGQFYVDIASVVADCLSGRKLVQTPSIPVGYRLVFLAEATNDVARIDISWFSSHLQMLLDTAPADTEVYCVLPQQNIAGRDSTAYRQAMQTICANVIDPVNCGVTYAAHDGKHWTGSDHAAFADCLRPIVGL